MNSPQLLNIAVKIHVNYVIKPNHSDNSYDVYEKDLRTKTLTFHSNHDTKEQAIAERNTLQGKPSQGDTIKFMRDLKQQIK